MIISRETLRGNTIAAKTNRMSDPTLYFFQIVDERIMVKPLSATPFSGQRFGCGRFTLHPEMTT
jgi:hypothetical protein